MWPCANFFIILFSFFLFFIFFPHERCSSMTGRALDALFLDVTDKFIVWTAFHDSSILHANSTAIHGNNCATIERRAKLKIGGRFIVASHRLEIKSSGDFAGQTVGNSRFSGFQWVFFFVLNVIIYCWQCYRGNSFLFERNGKRNECPLTLYAK